MKLQGIAHTVAMAATVAAAGFCPVTLRGQSVTVRDSAGVRIVENGPVADLPPALRISPVPMLDLGGDRGDPDAEIDPRAPLVTAARLSDGRYVVVDFDRLKLFDAEGRFLMNVGGPGEGPGEFKQVGGVCVAPGDTLVASSLFQVRVSVFEGQGRHVRTFTKQGRRYVVRDACFSDGSFLVGTPLPIDLEHDVVHYAELRRMNAHGEDLGVVDTLEAGFTNINFETTASFVVHDDALVAGDGTAPEYHVYDATGSLRRIVRWRAKVVVPTAEMLEDQVNKHLPRNASPAQRDYALAWSRKVPLPPRLPVYLHLRVDGAGRVWVQDPPSSEGYPMLWTVFDVSGAALGRVALPEIPGAIREDIRALGRNTVTLWWKDEALGFAHLTYHSMEPAVGG